MMIPTAARRPRRHRFSRHGGFVAALAVGMATGTMALPLAAHAGPRDFLIYAPGQGASSDEAKPYLEKLFRFLEKQLYWPEKSMSGDYADEPKAAIEYIENNKPGFGLLAPSMYFQLACRKGAAATPVTPIITIGSDDVSGAGKYFVIVKKGEGAPKTLEALKGKKLVSNQLGDLRFVSRLIFDGKIDAEKHFVLVPVRSSLKPLKQVDRGEADAALVDANQWKGIQKDPSIAGNLEIIYTSPEMPPYPVVAFYKVADEKDIRAMKQALILLCTTPEGIQICKDMRLKNPVAANPKDFKSGTEKYCK